VEHPSTRFLRHLHRARRTLLFCVSIYCTLLATTSFATSYALPPPQEGMIGAISHTTISGEQTLLDVARQFDLGYNEIIAANPDVDPWLPGVGTRVVVPTRFLLPAAARHGIVINVPEMRLYYYPPQEHAQHGRVITFPVGVGSERWETPLGQYKIIEKNRDPSWVLPASIIAELEARGKTPPKVLPPGPNNPLGQYALRLNAPSYLLHGTNRPYTIGRRVTHGCLRLYPEDIEQLFALVSEETPVNIVNQPYKAALDHDGALYLEAHAALVNGYGDGAGSKTAAVAAVVGATQFRKPSPQVWDKVMAATAQRSGMPVYIETLPAANEAWLLQVGLFNSDSAAQRLKDKMTAIDLPGNVLHTQGSRYHRVVVGPFTDRDLLDRSTQKIKQAVGTDSLIVAVEDTVF